MDKEKAIYLNSAAVAPLSEVAYKAGREYWDELYEAGQSGNFYEALIEADKNPNFFKEQTARLLNCNAEDITYIPNTSEGLILAHLTLPIESGDEVLLLNQEYPANRLPWQSLAYAGVDVDFIENKKSEESFEKLLDRINPHTRAVTISTAQYYDGFMGDLNTLSKICQKNGTYLILDAVQTIGIRKFDVQKTPVDFLVFGSQKQAQTSPIGIGGMYVNPRVIPDLKEIKVGMRGMERFDENSYTPRNNAARFETGTPNLFGAQVLGSAIKHINETGIEKVEETNLQKLHDVKRVLSDHEIRFIDHGDNQGNIVSMQLPEPAKFADALKDRKIYIKAIKDIARISFTANTEISGVEVVAKHASNWHKAGKLAD